MNAKDYRLMYLGLYATFSFLFVILAALLFYVACSRRYRLNWFEKNLLESAEDSTQSEEALVRVISEAGSSRSLNKSPSLTSDKFWVPGAAAKRHSLVSPVDSSAEENTSGPGSPTSHGSEPCVRNDKQIVLTTPLPRPRVSSMNTALDHTKIDTSLYPNKPEPDEKCKEPENCRGLILIGLSYDPAAEILNVKLVEARNLQTSELNGSVDPYAKIRLLPDRSNMWQTHIHKKTLNPVLDEDFIFETRPMNISKRTLEVIMYNFDAYSRHHSIGHVKIPLSDVDLSDRSLMWKYLEPCTPEDTKGDLGELMVSLIFLPSAERLTVNILKARNLRVVDDSRNSSNPYVKVSIIHNGRRIKKKKSTVFHNTVNPGWSEALTFTVSKETLGRAKIEFLVMHDSILSGGEVLGKAEVSHECERQFFHEMLTNKSATARWLLLTDSE
uniref:Synaptotagmin-9 n=1 Tax=Cacopsylla melanoneura TaxID=428564 RepID=A0A8D8SRQ3_9HEMI